jgi:glutathione S-transferase
MAAPDLMKAATLALYHFDGCPYCERVRGAVRRLGLEIELRDVHAEPKWRQELIAATGTQMVPCLRIEQPGGAARWLHESIDIIRYLETEVAPRG